MDGEQERKSAEMCLQRIVQISLLCVLLVVVLSCADEKTTAPSPQGPAISFLQPDITTREGARDGEGPGIHIPLARTDTTGRVTVSIKVQLLTADPEDFRSPCARYVSFEAGSDSASLNLALVPDTLTEGEERFAVSLDSIPSGYAAGRWRQVTVHVEDVEVHHGPAPAAWPCALGNSWSYQVEWGTWSDYWSSSWDGRYAAASAGITREAWYRGREYSVFHIEYRVSGWPPDRADFYFASSGDSLFFVPASDTLWIPETRRGEFPWVLAVFNESDSIARTYYDGYGGGHGITITGRQEKGPAIAVPAGAWGQTLTVRYEKENVGNTYGERGETWEFHLVADVGPIEATSSWWERGPDWASAVERAYLTGYSVNP